MKSNFKEFETANKNIYKKISVLEQKIKNQEFDFPVELRKTVEFLIKNEPLKKYAPKKFNNLGFSLNTIFKNENKTSIIEELGINSSMFYFLRKNFLNLKDQLNPHAHDSDDSIISKKLNLDEKVNLLNDFYEILNIIYFSSEKNDFRSSIYHFKDFFEEESLKEIFDNYIFINPEGTISEKFLSFLTKEILDIEMEEDIFYPSDSNLNNLTIQEDFLDVTFFNKSDKNWIRIKAYLIPKYSYNLDDFNKDVEKLKKNKDFQFAHNKESESVFFVFSPKFEKSVKNKLNDDFSNNDGNEIKIHLLDEKEIARKYRVKNDDRIPNGNFVFELKESNNLFFVKNDDYQIFFANILGSSIATAWQKTNGAILKKNIRRYIRTKKIDNSIMDTIKNHPQEFILYNNGITAFASAKDEPIFKKKYLKFDEFYIVNGGQTTKLISDIFNDNLADNETNKLSILAKIILIPNQNLDSVTSMINKVAETSNQQKPIKPQDLLTNDPLLLSWEANFNSKTSFSPYVFCLKRETIDLKKSEIKAIDFPALLQLTQSTLDCDPFSAKNSKSSIFSKQDVISETFNRLNLNLKQVQHFIFDLLTIDKEIDYCTNALKKNKDIDLTEKIVKNTILKTGKYFIIFLIYVFHLIKKIDYSEKKELFDFFRFDNLSSKDKLDFLKKISDKQALEPILIRKNYLSDDLENFEESTITNLRVSILRIVSDLFEKDRSFTEGKSNISSDWLKIFKQSEIGWNLAKPIIEKFIKSELYPNDSNDFFAKSSDKFSDFVNNCII